MKRLKVLSLAALVAFAACDEGSEPITVPEVTGTISGVVTIEGTARSGVSVTLSSGAAATTDASGAYSFAGVKAGTYTITISGFPTDATFSTTTKGATIATSGQVQTVNFDGAYVRTAAILGSVAAGGSGLAGVRVALTGTNTAGATVNTDGNGQYAFTGLRAGTYTVTISLFDATQFAFASTTATVTVTAGQSQVASFTGTRLATAKITGTVKIDGAAAAGVTATLSTGATATTDAAGAYTFSNLTAGAYTVTISGFAADAQFTSNAQTVTITSAGSTVNANFDGAYIKTSSIVGQVTVGTAGIPGVKVTLNTGATVNTDANGQYSFAALRAGTYTVTISGFDATMYTFATTASSVTVATGQSKVAGFAGAYVTAAKISGKLFIDELVKNDALDSSEATYALSGVTITIEGGAVNNLATTTTSDGLYEFANLVHGTYRVTITAPAAGTFAYGSATTAFIVTLTPGGTATVNFPFDIRRQYVKTEAFLGADAGAGLAASIGTRVRPEANVTIHLYDTYANAVAGGATGRLGIATTDATGAATFNFLRATDTSPAGATDNIVFARYVSTTNPNRAVNGEATIEIKYNAQDTLVVAPDEFDLLNTGLIVRFRAKDAAGNILNAWNYAVWDRSVADTTAYPGAGSVWGATTNAVVTPAALGWGRMAIAGIHTGGPTINLGALPAPLATNAFTAPDTLYVRFTEAALNNGLLFSQTAAITTGVARTIGSHLAIILDGTQPDSITLAGTQTVKYTQGRIQVKAHNEVDDTVRFTTLDPAPAADPVQIYIYKVEAAGGRGALVAGPTALNGTGEFTSPVLGADSTYLVVAQSIAATVTIVSDTAHTVFLSGNQQADTAKMQLASPTHPKGYSSFAWKYNNAQIVGQVRDASQGVPATGLKVWIKSTSRFIGPPKDTIVTVTAAGGAPCPAGTGQYCTFANLLEGPYTVQAMDGDSASVWNFLVRLTTTTVPVSGAVSNTNASLGSRDAQGAANIQTANFQATRMDTRIQGVIINDRDADGNVIDIDEALAGAQVQLYRDGSGAAVPPAIGTTFGRDTLVATATTDANGKYSFTGLQEGRYMVRWIAGTPGSPVLDVLRALSTDSVIVYTAATTVGSGANNTRVVGSTTPATLPRWDYANSAGVGALADPTHFMFLYKNTIARGTVKTAGVDGIAGTADDVAIAGMTISLRRCNTSPVNPAVGYAQSPPSAAGGTCITYLGTTANMVSDASGAFEFANLTEGIYEIRPQPTTVAGWNTSVPAQTLYLTVGNGDIEALNFVIS
ncbi:MAG TPA: carboxypeptidase regulatory-like domain-containing protein [Longimicrobiales bacterium]|nr:carboxypeptidase regulatory-like domain-containing protein [Longimicrobiales bacterium]